MFLLNAVLPIDLCQQVGWGQQLHRIPTADNMAVNTGPLEGTPSQQAAQTLLAWLQQSSYNEPRARTARENVHCWGHQAAGDITALLTSAKVVSPLLWCTHALAVWTVPTQIGTLTCREINTGNQKLTLVQGMKSEPQKFNQTARYSSFTSGTRATDPRAQGLENYFLQSQPLSPGRTAWRTLHMQ